MKCKFCNRDIHKTYRGWEDDAVFKGLTAPNRYNLWCEGRSGNEDIGFGLHLPNKEDVVRQLLTKIDESR